MTHSCPVCAVALTERLRCPGCGRWWEVRGRVDVIAAAILTRPDDYTPPPWVGSGYSGPAPEPPASRHRWATGGRKEGAP